jgi:hypothetical protein
MIKWFDSAIKVSKKDGISLNSVSGSPTAEFSNNRTSYKKYPRTKTQNGIYRKSKADISATMLHSSAFMSPTNSHQNSVERPNMTATVLKPNLYNSEAGNFKEGETSAFCSSIVINNRQKR